MQRVIGQIAVMTRRLAEVAARAGVSKPGGSEATRETVLTALDVLGYVRPPS